MAKPSKKPVWGKFNNPLKPQITPSKTLSRAERRRRLWRKIGRGSLIALGVLLLAIAIAFAWFSKDLPGPSTIANRQLPASTRIFDRSGTLLYEAFGDQKRTILKPAEVPELAKQAAVAAEDKNFYKHHGISFTGIARAILVRLHLLPNREAGGGSTITQQYVKNAIPEVGNAHSLTRKIKEAILTIELEQVYSKDEILADYLNVIPYGNTAAGIESATETYFSKSATKEGLSVDEAAFLAAIPQRPTYYNPWGAHTTELVDRRNYILGQMKTLGYINQQQYDSAKATDTLAKLGKRRENIQAPHFVFYIKELLAQKYGDTAVESGGLQVTTSLDLNIQKMAEDTIAERFPAVAKNTKASNAAMVVMDPTNGQVLAMVGSVDFFDVSKQGNVNVATSLRQPGSSFKPIVYSAAFKDKWNPGSTVFDLTTDFGGGYKPSNYDGKTHGPVSIRTALSNSLNIPAVKMISLVGVDNAIKQAKSMGITSLNRGADFYGPPLVLGSGEVRLLDLVSAYTTFANQGRHMPESPILKVTDQTGKVLDETKDEKGDQVLDPAIAFQISDILADNVARSTEFGIRSLLNIGGHTVAAKTGTTSDYKDAWTLGFTPSVAVGVWVGNNNGTPMVRGSAGAMAAAPLWNGMLTRYLSDKPDQAFTRPDSVQKVTIEKFSGKLPTDQTPNDDKITDWLAPWQLPKDKADAVVRVKVCRDSGLLATDNTPPDQVEDRLYANIHSEMPNNPNWEDPVQAWLQQNGFGSSRPPTEQCTTVAPAPTVAITSPSNNQTITGDSVHLAASVQSAFGVSQVEFLIDNISVGRSQSEPYTLTYPTNQLSNGAHEMAAVMTTIDDKTARDSVSFIVDKTGSGSTSNGGPSNGGSTTGGGGNQSTVIVISNIGAQSSKTGAVISWQTNTPATGSVDYGTTPVFGNSTQAGGIATSQSVTLSNLKPGSTYFYRITARADGSSTTSGIRSFTTQN